MIPGCEATVISWFGRREGKKEESKKGRKEEGLR